MHLCAAALLVFLAAATGTRFVPARLGLCALDLSGCGLGCAFHPARSVVPKAFPPTHLLHGVFHQASTGIVCESGQYSIFALRQGTLDIVKMNKPGIDQAFLVSLLDIVDQF